MLINSVGNNINFGAVWRIKLSKFTKSQNRVADDIELKLAKYSKRKDFVIEPLDNDIVELSEICCPKLDGNYIEYINPEIIGKYSEEHPFDIEDYKDVRNERDAGCVGILLVALLYFATFIFIAVPSDRARLERQAKKAVTNTIDSLQKVTKDTLQLTKDSLRMFK